MAKLKLNVNQNTSPSSKSGKLETRVHKERRSKQNEDRPQIVEKSGKIKNTHKRKTTEDINSDSDFETPTTHVLKVKKKKIEEKKPASKKQTKKQISSPNSDSDFETPSKKSKPTTSHARQPFQEYLDTKLWMRCAPFNIMEAIKDMTDQEKKWVEEMGFGAILRMSISTIPTRLAYWLVMNYDANLNELNMGNHIVKITPAVVHDIFGIPLGGEDIVEQNRPRLGSDANTDMFKNQFSHTRLRIQDVLEVMGKHNGNVKEFKLNFLVLFNTCIGVITKATTVNQMFIASIDDFSKISTMNWCSYMVHNLKKTKKEWKGIKDNGKQEQYNGPVTLLAILYTHEYQKRHGALGDPIRTPAIDYITTKTLVNMDGYLYDNGPLTDTEMDESNANVGVPQVQAAATQEPVSIPDVTVPENQATVEGLLNVQEEILNVQDGDGFEMPDTQEIINYYTTQPQLSGLSAYLPKEQFTDEEKAWNRAMDEKMNKFEALVSEINEHVNKGKTEHGLNIWIFDRCCDWENKFTVNQRSREFAVNKGGLNDLVAAVEVDLTRTNDLNVEDLNVDNTVDEEVRVTAEEVVNEDGEQPNNDEQKNDEDKTEEDQPNNDNEEEPKKDQEKIVEEKTQEDQPNKANAEEPKNDHTKNVEEKTQEEPTTDQPKKDNVEEEKNDQPKNVEEKTKDVVDIEVNKNVEDEEQNLNSLITNICKETTKFSTPTSTKLPLIAKSPTPIIEKKIQREERLKKTAPALNSPYLHRQIDMSEKITADEKTISEYILFELSEEKKYQIIYKSEFTEAFKFVFECFCPDIYISAGAVDIFTELLNFEEKKRDTSSSPLRFFATSTIMPTEYYEINNDTDNNKKLEVFTDNLERLMEKNKYESLRDVTLFFVPILWQSHFYLVVFNLKLGTIVLIDNSSNGEISPKSKFATTAEREDALKEAFKTRYLGVPEKLRDIFCMYLHKKKYPIAKRLEIANIKRLNMEWRTQNNHKDCAVFAIRHMETYKGKFPWSCDFFKESPKQKRQVNNLRIKYLSKVLLSEINTVRDDLIKEAKEFTALKKPRLPTATILKMIEETQNE